MMIDIKHIEDCYDRIKNYVAKTRLEKSLYLSEGDSEVYMKLECEQPFVKNFKIRGVLGKLTLLTDEQITTGVGTISSGNQGVSLAYGAQLLGINQPKIIAPTTSPKPKIEKMQYYGADINLMGETFDQANGKGESVFEEKGWVKIDAREDREGLYGPGTIGLEILEEMPDLDVILIPMGSGGNSIANGSYFRQKKPSVKVYAVEAENSPALIENKQAGRWTKFFNFPKDALMQSLVGGCAKHTYDNSDECIDKVLLVNDEEVRRAVYEMAQNEKVIAEPDSASVYAAYKRYKDLFKGKKTAMIITGGNISKELFQDIIKNQG
ncbi:MAG: pyridoxal-phosphate dependent enzyme [Anaerovoracaceae bacterium]